MKEVKIKNYPYHIGFFKVLCALDRKIEGARMSERADPILVTLKSTMYWRLIFFDTNQAEVKMQ